MRSIFVGKVVLLALALSASVGCASLHRLPRAAQGRLDLGIADRARTERRWIGLKADDGEVCPSVGAGWTQGLLFPLSTKYPGDSRDFGSGRSRSTYDVSLSDDSKASAERREDEVLRQKAGLNRFCLYQFEDKGPVRPPLQGSLLRLERDRAAVTAYGDNDLYGMLRPLLHERFREQAGALETFPTPEGPPSVRLSIVDTEPTGKGVPDSPGRSSHGFVIAQLAKELTSTASRPTPLVEIHTQLGLSAIRVDPKDPTHFEVDDAPRSPGRLKVDDEPRSPGHGGVFGTIGELASAIIEAVTSNTESHQVINLSLGWDGELHGGLDAAKAADLELEMGAVYQALRFAAAKGVLVLAASGNRRGGSPDSIGALLPAAWEARAPAPDDKLCVHGPLVYAVGGVQANDVPLANSRAHSQPPRAAYGDHAVLPYDPPVPPHDPPSSDPDRHPGQIQALTGTSISTVVVSATAALVWQFRPDLDREAVIDLVTSSGVPLPYSADFYPGKGTIPAPRVRRVLLCRALEVALPPWKARHCCSDGDPLFEARVEEALAPFAPAQKLVASFTRLPSAMPNLFLCPPGDYFSSRPNPDHPCPLYESIADTSAPWVYPQPYSPDPCPACSLTPDRPPMAMYDGTSSYSSTLRIKISDTFTTSSLSPGICLTSATLTVSDRRSHMESYTVPLQNLCTSGSVDLSLTTTINPVSGELTFLDADGKPYSSTLFVSSSRF